MESDPFFIDFETQPIETGWPPPRPVGVALLEPGRPVEYLAFGHRTGNNATREVVARRLADIVRNRRIAAHNVGFELAILLEHFGLTAANFDCTLVLGFLNDPDAPSLGLKELSAELLCISNTEEQELARWIADNVSKVGAPEIHYWECPGDRVSAYAVGDVIRCKLLFELLRPRIAATGMNGAYRRELELIPVLMELTRRGIRIDRPRLERELPEWQAQLELLEARIRTQYFGGAGINLGSNLQLVKALEAGGYVKKWERTAKGGKSTSADALEISVEDVGLRDALAMRNRLRSYISTFAEAWLKLARDDRVHAEWRGTRGAGKGGARTGRIISSNPNVQNIPKRPLEGLPNLRKFIIPDPGKLFLDADFDQQEFRIMAHYSGGELAEVFRDTTRKVDMHAETRDRVNAIAPAIKLDRSGAKTANFADAYGAGNRRLAAQLKIDVNKVRWLRKAQSEAFPSIARLKRTMMSMARNGQRIRTIGGRIYSPNPSSAYAYFNTLIQSSGSDVTKVAMLAANAVGLEIVLTAHDELLVVSDIGDAARNMRLLQEAMASVTLDVPWLTEAKWSSKDWGTLAPWSPAAEGDGFKESACK